MKYIRNPLVVFSSVLLASAANPAFSMEVDARMQELAGHRATVPTRVTADEVMRFIDRGWTTLRGLSPIASYRMVIEDLSHWISRAVEVLTFSENNVKQARGLAKLVEERGKELFTLRQLSAHAY